MILLALVVVACGPGGTPSDDPGRVTLHRLNNAEYNNTVRDLLGTALRPGGCRRWRSSCTRARPRR
jgi:hypothetical protein